MEQCSKKWKNLRDHFVREKEEEETKWGEGPSFVSRWPFFEMLTFLNDTVRHRA